MGEGNFYYFTCLNSIAASFEQRRWRHQTLG